MTENDDHLSANSPAPAVLPAPKHDLRRGTFWMLISLAGFTANSLLLKYLSSVQMVNPWMSLSFRFGIGLMITWAMFFYSGGLLLRRSFQSWLLASRGVLGGLSTAAFYLSIGPLGAGKCVLIGNTWTVFSALMAAIVLGEALSRARVVGIVIALSGLALLIGVGPEGFGKDWEWELVQLAGALMAAAVVVVIRQLTRTETSATIFASQCVYGLLLALPFALPHVGQLKPWDIVLLTLAAIMSTVGQLAMTEGFRFLTVAAGGGFQITLPLATSIGGVLLFGEHFSLWQMLGGLFILLGSYQAVVRGR